MKLYHIKCYISKAIKISNNDKKKYKLTNWCNDYDFGVKT